MEATIKKVAAHLSGVYYEIVTPEGRKDFVKLGIWDSKVPEQQILDDYLKAKLPSYLAELKEEIYGNPIRLFELARYSFGPEIISCNMSAWEYETLIKGNKKAVPALKMAYITQARDEGSWCVNCEAYDEESMVTEKNVAKVNNWLQERKSELTSLLKLSFTYGDILYSY